MQQEPLTIEDLQSPSNGARILRLHGPITLSNFFDFQAGVRSDKSQALIIDLTSVPYVDSAGVGALVGAYVNRHKDNRRLALVGVKERVLSTLKMTYVDTFFRRFDSLDAAERESA